MSLLNKFIARYRKNRKLRAKGKVRRTKKKPGFVKGMTGAVVGSALKDTGHIGKHIVKKLTEDGMGGVGGTPVNSASSGAIAGFGTSKDGPQAEPGVKKSKKTPLLSYGMFKRKTP